MSKLRSLLPLVLLMPLLAVGPCRGVGFFVLSPRQGELAANGLLEVRLTLPATDKPYTLAFSIDDVEQTPVALPSTNPPVQRFQFSDIVEGWHTLDVAFTRQADARRPRSRKARSHRFRSHEPRARERPHSHRKSVRFEMTTLVAPERCEILNAAECLFPFPSSRFLADDATTATRLRVELPEESMPELVVGSLFGFLTGDRSRLDPAPYNRNDGFSPTAQILMHFPGGVDLERSDVARLDPQTGNFDLRSLQRNHPTVLLDAQSGERIPHFLENDDRASGERVATILRPARSLLPGRRYIVAARRLVHGDGSAVEAEPVFATLRDRRPSSVEAVEARRHGVESVLRTLRRKGVRRHDLVLAFDFVTQSDHALTSEMLAMRDDALETLDAQPLGAGIQAQFVLDITPASNCAPDLVWRAVLGTFEVPNFLARNPEASVLVAADPSGDPNRLGFLTSDDAGRPVQTGTYNAQFGLAIPCLALLEGPVRPLLFGHGLFGNGATGVFELTQNMPLYLEDLEARGLVPADTKLDFGIAGTQWSGLSSSDIAPLPSDINFDDLSDSDIAALVTFTSSFVGKLFVNFDNLQALPDRLRQGQLANLVLGRHLERGSFNALAAFQAPASTAIPEGEGVLQVGELRYFGASLGGIMGLMFTALYPDLAAANVDVFAINFGFLLQRAKPFKPFQSVLEVIEPDPMRQQLGLGLLHELWVKGEPAGYAHHITGNTLPPLPGTSAKDVLMTAAKNDQQVSTLGAQIAAATLGIPNLPGSAERDLPGVPDASGRLRSGYIVYDTGSYAAGTPTEIFIPPPVNRPAPADDNRCDPHAQRYTIPASLLQLLHFFAPGGTIENFCNGACDAAEALELPGGLDTACDPFAP